MSALWTIFVEAMPAGAPANAADALGEALERCVAQARAAWSDLSTPTEDFVRHLASLLRGEREPAAVLGALHAADLYLAFACVRREQKALVAFDQRYLAKVPAYLARVQKATAVVEEVRQALEERLCAGAEGSPPALAEYAGRGALDGWVRTAAVRTALNLQRGEARRRVREQRAWNELGVTPDPELQILRERHRADFEAAFEESLGALVAEERRILRMRFVDALGVSEIATLTGVHRATVSRWLAAAQESLLTETRRRLATRLGVSPSECDSLFVLVRSHLDITLQGLLTRSASRTPRG